MCRACRTCGSCHPVILRIIPRGIRRTRCVPIASRPVYTCIAVRNALHLIQPHIMRPSPWKSIQRPLNAIVKRTCVRQFHIGAPPGARPPLGSPLQHVLILNSLLPFFTPLSVCVLWSVSVQVTSETCPPTDHLLIYSERKRNA